MNAQTPHHADDEQRKHELEEKLREHIQREFSLGEKVISLLKQKKDLEADLQQQQQTRAMLEQKLEEMIKSKEVFEQKYQLIHRELEEQQQRLRSRSQLILENEENSRQNLQELRQKIATLEQQLETVDQQKVEEQKRLVRQIQHLRRKEYEQSKHLRQISHQRDLIEKRLHELTCKYQQILQSYQEDKQVHDQQLDAVFQEQINQEASMENLLEQHQDNEAKLEQEIADLKISKAQLEEQLQRMKQQISLKSQDSDTDLLRVIEKQQRYIEDLKEKAHQRSTILRTENETIRNEMEDMIDRQEKMKWENQMLESSLKSLQTDLAEYIQLQKRFEEVQREKETFEEKFHRKIQFLEEQPEESEQGENTHAVPQSRHKRTAEERILQVQKQEKQSKNEERKRSFKSRIVEWFSLSHDKLLNTAFVLVAIILAIQIVRLIPWDHLGTSSPPQPTQTLLQSREESPRKENRWSETLMFTSEETVSPALKDEAAPVEKSESASQTPRKEALSPLPQAQDTITASSQPPTRPSAVAPPKHTSRATSIVVKLIPDQASRFLSRSETSLPTPENNSILRRHNEQKSVSSPL